MSGCSRASPSSPATIASLCSHAARPSAIFRTISSVCRNEKLNDHLASPPAQRPRERLWQIRARSVVLATGAIERPLVFPGNDRPGIMLAGAAHTYLNRFGVRVGTREVIVTCGDDAYQTALDLQSAGVAVVVVADLRAQALGRPPRRRAARRDRCACGFDRSRDRRRFASHGHHPRAPGGQPGASRATFCLRCGVDVRRIHPERAPLFAIARQTQVERNSQGLRTRHVGRVRTLGRRLPRHLRSCRGVGGWCGGRSGRSRCRGGRHGRRRGAGAAPRAASRWRRPCAAAKPTSACCRKRIRRAAEKPSSTGSTM